MKKIGRGRTPCCDKSRVIKGPWSSAEDLRLISFIQKYGHENWRALPKLAGLLRCGKSCRLRWVNYLRPNIKRGNFTKEEEDTIIRLHQSIGNKWSMIAAHLPGRTDNEIKNVWNSHLKKRLSQRPSAFREDVTKESSMTFSSSTTTVESDQNFQNVGIDNQSYILPHDVSTANRAETEYYEPTFAPNQFAVANQVSGLQSPELLTNFGSMCQHPEQLMNFSDNDPLENFTLWEDPNVMDCMLNVNADPSWALPTLNTGPYSVGNNSSHELITEADFDTWSMPNILEAPMSDTNMNAAQEYITDEDMYSLLESLEHDPKLAQNPGQCHVDVLQQSSQAAATGYGLKEIPGMDYFRCGLNSEH